MQITRFDDDGTVIVFHEGVEYTANLRDFTFGTSPDGKSDEAILRTPPLHAEGHPSIEGQFHLLGDGHAQHVHARYRLATGARQHTFKQAAGQTMKAILARGGLPTLDVTMPSTTVPSVALNVPHQEETVFVPADPIPPAAEPEPEPLGTSAMDALIATDQERLTQLRGDRAEAAAAFDKRVQDEERERERIREERREEQRREERRIAEARDEAGKQERRDMLVQLEHTAKELRAALAQAAEGDPPPTLPVLQSMADELLTRIEKADKG